MQRQGSGLENGSSAFLTGSSFLIWATQTQICNDVASHSGAAKRRRDVPTRVSAPALVQMKSLRHRRR